MKTSISVIVTTYNRPQALKLVLSSLNAQTYQPLEVIVADDGSQDETRVMVEQLKQRVDYTLIHCWHPDEGFRAAKIRNLAVKDAHGDYLVFLDGDCIAPRNFLLHHITLKEKGFFVAGNRILINKELTLSIEEQQFPIYDWDFWRWIKEYLHKNINRFSPLLNLYLGKLRYYYYKDWRGVKSCNLALAREDFLTVKGFDEAYIGWGYEDSDLAIRLIEKEIYHKSGKFYCPVFHLWHTENERLKEQTNRKRLGHRLKKSGFNL